MQWLTRYFDETYNAVVELDKKKNRFPVLSYIVIAIIVSGLNFFILNDLSLGIWLTAIVFIVMAIIYAVVFSNISRGRLKPSLENFAKLSLITISFTAAQILGGIYSHGMFLYLAFLAIISTQYGIRLSLELIFPIIAIETAGYIISTNSENKIEELALKIFILAVFSYLIGFFSKIEKRSKNEIQEKLANLELGMKALQTAERQFDIVALRESLEQKRLRISRSLMVLEDSLSLIADIAMETFDCESCAIFVTETNNKEHFLQLRAIKSKNISIVRQKLAIESGKGLLGLLLKEKKPIIIPKMKGHAYDTLPYYEKNISADSFFAFPVMSDIRFEGILCFDKKTEGDLTASQYKTISHLVKQIATSIAYAKSQDRAEDKAQELLALYEASKALSSSIGVDSTLRTIVLIAKDIINYDSCLVALQDEEDGYLYISAASGYQEQFIQNKKFSSKDGLYGWVMQQKQSVLFSGKIQDSQVLSHYRKEGLIGEAKSFLVLPLIIGEKIIGILQLNSEIAGFFTEYDQEILGIFANQASIAVERARLYESTKEMAVRDGLTGLFNHRYFQEQLEAKIQNYKQNGKTFSLIMCDIDHFKQLNDTYGHLTGDKILKQIAKLLKETCPEESLIARYGGEEFIIILPDMESKTACNLAEKIRKSIETKSEIQPRTTASLGIASFPIDAQEQRELIHCSDMALYQAKEEGRNRIIVFQKSLRAVRSCLGTRHE